MATSSSHRINTLQIGMGWFPEQPGGLNRMFIELMHHLPKEGIGCAGLVTGNRGVASQSSGTVQACAPASSGILRRLGCFRSAITAKVHHNEIDLVASHFALYSFAALDKIKTHKPMVVHFHGPWALEDRFEQKTDYIGMLTKKAIERAVYHSATKFIVLSNAFRQILVTNYGIDPCLVVVIPGGVRMDTYVKDDKVDARQQLGWPLDRPIILTVRRLVRRMGLDNLLRAMQYVRLKVPDALLTIVGDGYQRNELALLSTHLGLANHVYFTGRMDDERLSVAYCAADLVIVPTAAFEGFGLTAAEALAAGRPVLVTPQGGLPEVVSDLSSNLVLHGCSPDHIAEGLCAALCGNLPLPTEQHCREFARQKFDWLKVTKQVAATYRTLA